MTRSAAHCGVWTTCPARRSTWVSSTRRPPVLRGRRRARRHAGAPPRVAGAGTRLGASAAIPFFGGMTGRSRATLQDPLPDTTWIYSSTAIDTMALPPGKRPPHRAPVEPMLGTEESHRPAARSDPLVPDRFVGDMDTPQIASRRPFLGVNVEGALFSIGDAHYRQGEGEASAPRRGCHDNDTRGRAHQGGAPAWPRLEDDTHSMTWGSSRPIEDSWRIPDASSCAGSISSTACTDRCIPALLAVRPGTVANVVDATTALWSRHQGASPCRRCVRRSTQT